MFNLTQPRECDLCHQEFQYKDLLRCFKCRRVVCEKCSDPNGYAYCKGCTQLISKVPICVRCGVPIDQHTEDCSSTTLLDAFETVKKIAQDEGYTIKNILFKKRIDTN